MTGDRELGRDRAVGAQAEKRGDRCRRQGLEREPLGQRSVLELDVQPVAATSGCDDDDRQSLDPPDEKAEKAERWLIEPLQVVGDEQQRLSFGEIRGKPEETVQGTERRIAPLAVE